MFSKGDFSFQLSNIQKAPKCFRLLPGSFIKLVKHGVMALGSLPVVMNIRGLRVRRESFLELVVSCRNNPSIHCVITGLRLLDLGGSREASLAVLLTVFVPERCHPSYLVLAMEPHYRSLKQ